MNQQATLEFAASDEIAGFRLKRLELYNWGTFHNRVWTLNPEGHNILVTGDIGSGKSTLIDAITTLLVPPNRIIYNKAAGADKSERSLRTYVLGYYKSERSESGLSAKPVALRDQNSFSVILGVFANEGYSQTISLAQVFSCHEPTGQPDRFYVVSSQELSIKEHFSNFGSELGSLKKKLKQAAEATLYDSFSGYCAEFKRYFGISGDQALELFNQTVSMKSVGNLTGFVREHMLQEFDVQERIDRLLKHYEDLNRAHAAVLKARAQIEKLSVIADACDRHDEISHRAESLRFDRDHLRHFFALKKQQLLQQEELELQNRLNESHGKIADLKSTDFQLRGQRDELKQQIAANGGDRIERLKTLMAEKTEEKERAQKKSESYQRLATQIALGLPDCLEAFFANRRLVEQNLPEDEEQEVRLQNEITEKTVELHHYQSEQKTLRGEIESLKLRKSNIPVAQISIRKQLCLALGVEESDLPFAGELIKVRDTEKTWEGAAERLLHNFGLSLLVPEKVYAAVAEWVDKTDLLGRLVYFRIKPASAVTRHELHRDSLVRKLEIKNDSEFFDWLENELGRRFDYACCESVSQFRSEHQAVTRNGQVKSGGHRHEKDDRHDLGDRGGYVLGWSNEAKVRVLLAELYRFETLLSSMKATVVTLNGQRKGCLERKSAGERLLLFEHFAEIDWHKAACEIAELEKERLQLEAASDVLRQLLASLKEVENKAEKNLLRLEKTGAECGRVEGELSRNRQAAEDLHSFVEAIVTSERSEILTRIEPQCDAMLTENALTLRNCGEVESQLREQLQTRIDADNRRLKTLEEQIIGEMQNYRRDYPLETQEFDARVEAASEYRESLKKLREDSLPSFETRFRKLLTENTINEIANFHSQLNRECQEIRERIEKINRSLAEIDYNPGRFIRLEEQFAVDADVRDFRQELRACTEGSLTGSEDEQYTENKFMRVKAIIERFKGREGLADSDQRWMRKVTDVRNWFVFAASERRKEDGSEYEHYTDSGGKSGGQKEKLAYTVLAASLAYQFGLERGTVRSRSFRFVVIDEAFGRGSEESTRYGLELFRQLNLQLLVVTPLQKIHVIEPYVDSVGFVYGSNGNESLLRSLTIAEYQAERESRSA